MTTIAFCNHKGGVGKTTSTASVGVAMARQGKRVLLVDLDGQANLTSIFLQEEAEESIYDSLVEKAPLYLVHIEDNLDLVPSNLNMSAAEAKMTMIMVQREMRLANLLASQKTNYDYILIDCPPSLGIVTINAFFAADEIYVPVAAEILPLKGMMMIENVLEDLREAKPDIKISGVFVTRFDSRKNINKSVEEAVRAQYEDVVFQTHIRDHVSLSEAPGSGSSIFDYDSKGRGAQDYLALTQEILERTK
ncbi:MAG: ParA family protein [Segatella copri]